MFEMFHLKEKCMTSLPSRIADHIFKKKKKDKENKRLTGVGTKGMIWC